VEEHTIFCWIQKHAMYLGWNSSVVYTVQGHCILWMKHMCMEEHTVSYV
jgi:hypothetical protein